MGAGEHIEDLVSDLVADFLFYDRKGDEEIPLGFIEAAVVNGAVTEAEIVALFAKALHLGITEGR